MLQFSAADLWDRKLSTEVAKRAEFARRELAKENQDVLPAAQEKKHTSD